MKFLKYFCLLAIASIAISCNKKENKTVEQGETEGLVLIKTIEQNNHKIKLWSSYKTQFQTGYNPILLQITDANDVPFNNIIADWQFTMHMMGMTHNCPISKPEKIADKTSLLLGYSVFQMASNADEYWEIDIDYTLNGSSFRATDRIDVIASPKRVLESFVGTDQNSYLLALVEPANPKVAVNDMSALLFKMGNMNTYSIVSGYTIKIDPRMPGMGNHGSPNNVDLTQRGGDVFYNGKLSLTMTGYWKINLQLSNLQNEILKGEPVTSSNEGSSIFFEIEF